MDLYSEMRKGLNLFKTDLELVNNIGEVMKKYPDFDLDSLSKGQLLSKAWLVNTLKKSTDSLWNTFILGGWYGILANLLFSTFEITTIRSIDIDPSCEPIADEINIRHVIDGWRFKALTMDCNDIDKLMITPDTIINTSCEHMTPDWFLKVQDGTLVVLQSTNFELDTHINPVKSAFELKEMFPLSEVKYFGELFAIDYYRFMLIGRK